MSFVVALIFPPETKDRDIARMVASKRAASFRAARLAVTLPETRRPAPRCGTFCSAESGS